MPDPDKKQKIPEPGKSSGSDRIRIHYGNSAQLDYGGFRLYIEATTTLDIKSRKKGGVKLAYLNPGLSCSIDDEIGGGWQLLLLTLLLAQQGYIIKDCKTCQKKPSFNLESRCRGQ